MDFKSACTVRHAHKRYGRSGPWVLKDLKMTIPQNQIYGLLGSSGCGKTTLLKCLVGALDLDYGSIDLIVKSKKQIGFMPQETSLFEEFTIAESFYFHAALYRLSKAQAKSKIKELTEVLDLPPDHRVCSTLSGGQVRRVSIAMTLLHSPSLVILDEPTSGLDPVLANLFWRYLNQLSVQGQSIIITTHYIEEARQANVVGLMRQGVLLAEDAPEKLIAHYKVDNLEDVFLCLCNEQETALPVEVEAEKKITFTSPFKDDANNYSMFVPHTKAILYKNCKWIIHNWFAFIMLSYCLSLACIIESNECLKYFPPQRVGVVNNGENGTCVNYDPSGFNCSEGQRVDFSCQLLDAWRKEKPQIPLSIYNNINEAMKDGKARKLITILEIPYNFTSGILERFDRGTNADSELIETASMDIHIDSTDYMAVYRIEQDLRDVFYSVFKDHLKSCGYLPQVAKPPLRIKQDAFFGKNIVYQQYDYSLHIAMACMCSITYLVPLFLLTISLCLEKMSGAYTRVLVGGVRIVEIFAGYLFMIVIFNFTNTAAMGFDSVCYLWQTLWQFLAHLHNATDLGILWDLVWFLCRGSRERFSRECRDWYCGVISHVYVYRLLLANRSRLFSSGGTFQLHRVPNDVSIESTHGHHFERRWFL
ncbi:hypothetical protein WDU94_003138 [Cyamophila willieti]